ncbi:hypothetical protein NE237_017684 [Protea cynaroides]|uniref:Uncharacterized protein n=1 Tax=Protea cynaroides TaxID=273540 RepID=A0A9Q0QN93_9MAGN|nr:hypothetical protein NE237_017684 [Protea cynaroides]
MKGLLIPLKHFVSLLAGPLLCSLLQLVDELQGLSSALSTYRCRWDELQKHITFIQNTIEVRLMRSYKEETPRTKEVKEPTWKAKSSQRANICQMEICFRPTMANWILSSWGIFEARNGGFRRIFMVTEAQASSGKSNGERKWREDDGELFEFEVVANGTHWCFRGNKDLDTPPEITIRGVLGMLKDTIDRADSRSTIPLGHGDPSCFPSFRTIKVAEKAIADALHSANFN